MCLEMKCNKIYHCALATRNATDLIDLMFICYIWQHKTQHDQNCHFSFRPTFKSSPDSKSNHTCEVKYISYIFFRLAISNFCSYESWFIITWFCKVISLLYQFKTPNYFWFLNGIWKNNLGSINCREFPLWELIHKPLISHSIFNVEMT